ncbi:MAG: hypothetical protein H0W31_00125 [Actinobacteria bacterium]|nr:hypothetical protein [Actinomycetota bacterium]
MSDLYLDLRRRIPLVAEWTDVGDEEMERAQARLGLSDERLARLIPISAKTWVRWKRRGQIPTHYLPKVAPILGFEIVPMEPVEIAVATQTSVVTPDLRESLAELVELSRRQAEIAERSEAALGRIELAIRETDAAPRRVRRVAKNA